MEQTLVSGPQNVFRLVGPKGQIVYLFIDTNNGPELQLQCPSVVSRTIKDYLRDQLQLTDPTSLSFAFSVNHSDLQMFKNDPSILAPSYLGIVLRMTLHVNGLAIVPINLGDLIPGSKMPEIGALRFDPNHIEIFKESVSSEKLSMLESQLVLVGNLISMMKDEIVPATFLPLIERIEPIRSSPLFSVCTTLLYSIRRSLTDMIEVFGRASEMLAGIGRRYFVDIIGENYVTELPYLYLVQLSRDLSVLRYKTLHRWLDYQQLLSALCYVETLCAKEGMSLDDERRRYVIYANGATANNILEIMIKYKSFQITHVAYMHHEIASLSDLNTQLAQIPVEEYNLLLISQDQYDDVPVGYNDRPSQCANLSGFPKGFQ